MFLLFLLISICCTYDFYALNNDVNGNPLLSQISSETLNITNSKILNVAPHILTRCATLGNEVSFVAINKNFNIYTLYTIDFGGNVKNSKIYDLVGNPVYDEYGNLYVTVFLNTREIIIKTSTNETKYTPPRGDYIQEIKYDEVNDVYYLLVMRWGYNKQFIEIMKDWGLVDMFLMDIGSIMNIIPFNNTILALVISNKGENELWEIEYTKNSKQQLLVGYNGYNGGPCNILRGTEIHSIMRDIRSKKYYWVITDLNTLNYTSRYLVNGVRISCIF
jgi:hypothetical protein